MSRIESLDDLYCPECGALADDLDDHEAMCSCGAVWILDPESELWISPLLAVVRRLSLSLESRDLEIAELRVKAGVEL